MAAVTVAQPVDPSPFHVGEQRVQDKVGAKDISEKLGRAWHSKTLSAKTADFFSRQPLLYTATKLWASVLAGPPGFLTPDTSSSMTISPLRQFFGDPAELGVGELIGTLGIVLETRQRERLNGVVEASGDGEMRIGIQQSFSGCPKYIQGRKVWLEDSQIDSIGQEEREVTRGDLHLGEPELDFIARSDTFFLATCYYGPLDNGDGVNGCDNSYRGGPPGFVQATAEGVLEWADFVGNYNFTTLGNLIADPRAAIQFLDFSTGDSLQLSGQCHIRWDDTALPGAQRTMEFQTERWVHVREALPLRTDGEVAWSPYNPLPDSLYSAETAAQIGKERLNQLETNYILPESARVSILRCLSVTREADDVMTFEFETPDSSASRLARGYKLCNPGQFVSFDFEGLGPGTLNRTWTISSTQSHIADRGAFTITVKKAGLVSGWLFENMQPSRTIRFRGVDGDFTLDRGAPLPAAGALLIAGGIGVTPMRVMLHECIARGVPVTLLYCVRRREDAVFLEEFLQAEASTEGGTVQVAVTLTSKDAAKLTQPMGNTMPKSGWRSGRITAAMILEVCPDVTERVVFQCGPPRMMNRVADELATMEFPLKNLHEEKFDF